MRVLVSGDSPTAKALRGNLARHDFHLTGHFPDFTVWIEEQAGLARPLLDSVHCELEQAILRHLRKQTITPVEIHTAGGIGSDREVRIVVPPVEEERRAVEVGVFRALLELSGQTQTADKSWWRALIRRNTK
jgi:hypothetical protein